MNYFSRRDWLAMAGAAGVAMTPACRVAVGAEPRATGGADARSAFARNVLEFGARGDGRSDNTVAFQKALDSVHSAGGGIVHVPTGWYLFKGHLTIPENTSLEGVFRAPPAYVYTHPQSGTVLLPTEGRGRDDGAPFIGIGGINGTIRGLAIYYPEQDPDAIEPVPYPWTIGCLGAQQNLAVIDVALTNPYQGINLTLAGRHYVACVYGRPIKTGIYVDQCYDIGRIENIHFFPFWGGVKSRINAWTKSHGTAFCFGRSDGQYVLNTFLFEYHTGYHFIHTPSGSCYGNFVGLGADTCHYPLKVDMAESTVGLQITNGEFAAYLGVDPQVFMVGLGNSGPVCMTNCSFWGSVENFGTVQGTGPVSLIGCNFNGRWGGHDRSAPAILCDGAPVIISNCRFQPAASSGTIIAGITPRCVGAVITGNMAMAGAFVVDHAQELPASKFQIHSNIAVG